MLEMELRCSICLDIFSLPVTTTCGHNFCKGCIQCYLEESNSRRCPFCKKEYTVVSDPHVNTVLNSVVEHVKALTQCQGSDSDPPEEGAILCTICPNKKAVKSCLTCLASFCQFHLDLHQRVPGLRFHTFRDPLSNLEERLCKTHNRPREMYCRTEREFVCVECFRSDHEGHNVVPLMEEFQLVEVKSKAAKAGLQKMIEERSKKKSTIEESVKLVEVLRETSTEILISLCGLIEKLNFDNEMKALMATRKAREFLEGLEKEINDLKEKKQLLEMLPNCRDYHDAIQTFPTLSNPLVTNWSNIHNLVDKRYLVRIKALVQLKKLFRELPEIQEMFTQGEGEDVPSVQSVLVRGEV